MNKGLLVVKELLVLVIKVVQVHKVLQVEAVKAGEEKLLWLISLVLEIRKQEDIIMEEEFMELLMVQVGRCKHG